MSTTVIEVGVDVPAATMMVIMDAERFGMSQLHQLRGRVARGGLPGLCLLVTAAEPGSPGRGRLDAVAATTDGFALSDGPRHAPRGRRARAVSSRGGAARCGCSRSAVTRRSSSTPDRPRGPSSSRIPGSRCTRRSPRRSTTSSARTSPSSWTRHDARAREGADDTDHRRRGPWQDGWPCPRQAPVRRRIGSARRSSPPSTASAPPASRGWSGLAGARPVRRNRGLRPRGAQSWCGSSRVLVESSPRGREGPRGECRRRRAVPGARVVVRDARRLAAEAPPAGGVDLCFADPPYDWSAPDVRDVLAGLAEAGWLADGARVIVERPVPRPDQPAAGRLDG